MARPCSVHKHSHTNERLGSISHQYDKERLAKSVVVPELKIPFVNSVIECEPRCLKCRLGFVFVVRTLISAGCVFCSYQTWK